MHCAYCCCLSVAVRCHQSRDRLSVEVLSAESVRAFLQSVEDGAIEYASHGAFDNLDASESAT